MCSTAIEGREGQLRSAGRPRHGAGLQPTRRRWSAYLLYGIVATLPLGRIPSLLLPGGHPIRIRIGQVLALGFIALCLGTIWEQRRRLIRAPWVWLGGFVAVCALGITVAADPVRAALVTAYTGFVALLGLAIAISLQREWLDGVERWLFVGTAGAVGFGLFQFFGDFAGLPHFVTGLRDQYGKGFLGFPRIQSTGLEPLYFGNFLLLPIAIQLTVLVFHRLSRPLAALLLASLTTLWLTVSRGALGALFVIMAVLAVLAARRRLGRRIFAMLAYIILSLGLAVGCVLPSGMLALGGFWSQSTTVTTGASSIDRALCRRLAVEAFLQDPWLGLGPGNFGSYAHSLRPVEFTDDRGIANNETLEILAETGLAGFLLFALFVGSVLASSLPLLRDPPVSQVRLLALGILCALIGIAAQFQTFSTLYIIHVWVAIGLLLGLIRLDRAKVGGPWT